ncbi:ABC transporter substrate-binding protein [Paenibacillus segetis]|uniref:Iron-uptake system-binding protein n=1 Tax=Paenibacillus segetis TaxID=1325360 RepID=A0ABQ1Y875_9BACL|nr:ABC transporter substrate-binding protein [Paenibacillus segetis]GGH14979.1 iron-uptake system-binding protein [Paenibacillus segetis]
MKRLFIAGTTVLLAMSLAACGSDNKNEANVAPTEPATVAVDTSSTEATSSEQTITYLGKDYTLPAQVNNIVAASLESMEDAAILGIKPVGVLSIANAIPTYLEKELAGATLIGDKFAPNNEAILGLNPDVILGSSKFGDEVVSALNKIQTMIPYSHISTNWKDNLNLLAQLTGKESQASTIIADYDAKAAEAKLKISETLKDKKIIVVRIREGSMCVYPATVYLNPILYDDLGVTIPDVIAKTEAQAELSLEGLAEVNPDYIFLQFETSENTDAPKALEKLLDNAIFKSTEAAKNNHVFVNAIDPLAQGGTAWSKVKFLDVAIENLLK